ncbi:unnamed protein product [Pedinophyceae sp. YPF-701]|nr:unnamed protein product [Pedinophyceae sp. YPF-701]
MAATDDWSEYHKRWENIWSNGLEPNQLFDIGGAHPILVQTLRTGDVNSTGRRALVPGCGRGYDVEEFARNGAVAVGLEISASAARAANDYIATTSLSDSQKKLATVVEGDFFAGPTDGVGQVALGYDYTFFCAIRPDMRRQWAETWAQWIEPGGELLTMMFPCREEVEPSADGPPFSVHPDAYRAVLEPAGFEVVRITDVPAEMSHKDRVGREKIGIFRRK